MKVNYEKTLELNKESTSPTNGDQLGCWYLIQLGLERYLNNEPINNEYIKFLTQVGVLEPESQEERQIVKPFNFMGNDGPQSN